MTDPTPILLHLYKQAPRFSPDKKVQNLLKCESLPYDMTHLIERNLLGLVLEVDTFNELYLEHIKTAFGLGKTFVIILLSTHKEEPLFHEVSLLTQSVFFPIPDSEAENAILNTALIPMLHTQLERLHYIETLKFRAHNSGLVESLNVVAHQWRQPINLISMEAINLSIQSALDGHVSAESIQQSIQIISDQTQRMSSILKSVLNMGKTHRGNESFSINEMMDRIEFFFTEQLQRHRIELHFVRLDQDTSLLGYQTDMEEVLANLISNAKDAFGTSSANESRRIDLEASGTPETVVLLLRDNAGGIPQELREKIFEPHFSTKNEGEGFGIGLHIARTIIEQEFKGSLALSVEGGETLFTITVPRSDVSQLKFINL